VTTVPFQARLTIRRDEEFAVMFDQGWRALAEQFYDGSFHGRDWKAIRQKYRPLLKHVALKEDFYHLVQQMLGELNASHLGIAGYLGNADAETADLGLLLDDSYRGPGLRISEVLKGGPADRRGLGLRVGDVILGIDGTEWTDRENLARLLNDKVNETVVLEVVTPKPGAATPVDPKSRRRVEVQGAARHTIQPLMYDRWVARNAERVSKLSGGKLGYIHIPSMNEDGVDRFVRALYSDNYDKEAIVLDVRYNGGGFTHDQVLNYLGSREHTVFRHRRGNSGLVMRWWDRKWHKPVVMLINNRSFSDAEIFPHAFRTLGLGKLVGQATGGWVIGTSPIRLIDGSTFRVPRIGVYTIQGVNMEKEGVVPDIVVEEHPDQLAKGIDAQLDRAVEVLRQEVAAWMKKRSQAAKAAGRASSMPDAKR
jgi:tricorn protease